MNVKIRDVDANLILDESHKMKHEGYRLMQICATRAEIPAADAPEGEGVKQIVVDGNPIEGTVIPYSTGHHHIEVTM